MYTSILLYSNSAATHCIAVVWPFYRPYRPYSCWFILGLTSLTGWHCSNKPKTLILTWRIEQVYLKLWVFPLSVHKPDEHNMCRMDVRLTNRETFSINCLGKYLLTDIHPSNKNINTHKLLTTKKIRHQNHAGHDEQHKHSFGFSQIHIWD